MGLKVTFPFFTIQLRFLDSFSYHVPVTATNKVRLGSIGSIVSEYQRQFQENVLEAGEILDILQEIQQGDFLKDKLSVNIPASSDGFTYPELDLEFEYFRYPSREMIRGFVPALDVHALAPTEEELRLRLVETILLRFTAENAFNNLPRIITAFSSEVQGVEQQLVELECLTPAEVALLEEIEGESMLRQVASLLKDPPGKTFGLEKELKALVKILKNPFHRSLTLVGPNGIGKTALLEEAVRRQTDLGWEGKIWKTTAASLVKEMTNEYGWQDNLLKLAAEMRQSASYLYLPNLMELFEVGQYIGNEVSMGEFILPLVAKGELFLIGECTPAEKARIELLSPNYFNAFHVLSLSDKGKNMADIIRRRTELTARSWGIEILPDAVAEAIRLNQRFSPYAGFPGKPVRFLENLLHLHRRRKNWSLDRSEAIRAFCEESGMPQFMVDPEQPMDPEAVKQFFAGELFGQERAIDSLVDVLATVKTGLAPMGKPIASFLFVGPTGVGKTELAKLLSQFMFGSRDALVRFDMSEYSSPYSVQRLVGIEGDSDGLLTSAVRRNPFSVVLFDEVEKAHPNFMDFLLQILSEGRLTDNRGQLANFCSAIIIMTSNLGASNLQTNRISWKKELNLAAISDHFTAAVQKHFRPELINRIDQILPFEPLTRETMRQVIDREIKVFREREGFRFRKITLDLKDSALDVLMQKGFHELYGARYLQRQLQSLLAEPLAACLNSGETDDKISVCVTGSDETLKFEVQRTQTSLTALMSNLRQWQLAELVSEMRRKLYQLREGPAFHEVLSEIGQLNYLLSQPQPKKHGARLLFPPEKRLSDCIQLQNQLYQKIYELEDLEIEMDMMVYQDSPQEKDIDGILNQMNEWILTFSKAMFEALYAPQKHDNGFLVLGANPYPLVRFYSNLCRLANFPFYCQGRIWHSDKIPPGASDFSENLFDGYYIDDLEENIPIENQPAPEKYPHATLVGVVCTVEGATASLFLAGEAGKQIWEMKGAPPLQCAIRMANFMEKGSLEPNMHRKEYYKNMTERRVVTETSVRDRIYKWNFNLENGLSDFPRMAESLLQAHFRRALHNFAFGKPKN